jgi:hypothetical protein
MSETGEQGLALHRPQGALVPKRSRSITQKPPEHPLQGGVEATHLLLFKEVSYYNTMDVCPFSRRLEAVASKKG